MYRWDGRKSRRKRPEYRGFRRVWMLRTSVFLRSIIRGRGPHAILVRKAIISASTSSLAGKLELLPPAAAVLGDVDVVLRVHRDAVGLVELARIGSGTADAADVLAALTLD